GVAALTGWGLQAPGLTFFPVIVCTCCAVSTRGRGLVISAVAMALVAMLAVVDATLLTPATDDSVPRALRGAILVAGVAISAVVGLTLSGQVQRHVRRTAERERRFRELLGIAATAYFETDAKLQVRHLSLRASASTFSPVRPSLRQRMPWELPELELDAGARDALRRAMQSGQAFRDLPMVWHSPDGEHRHLLGSGAPRLDERKRLLGYWCVLRDVTRERSSRDALQITEQRYQQLFALIPTPLVIHRDGLLIDANPAAAKLFGFGSVGRMIGRELAEVYPPPMQAVLRARLVALRKLAVGQPLAPIELDLVSLDGRPLRVSATGLRIEVEGGPAVLSFYIDQTAQYAAAQAHRESEALLVQLVSMSPDIITLTDLKTGRYMMANDAFSRVTGHAREQVIGRTAMDIGIWHNTDERDRLIAALGERGYVEDHAVSFVGHDGTVLPMLVSASRFERDGRAFLVINARDMTQAQQARLEREASLTNASVGIALTRERRFVLVNPHFEQMFRWPPGALVGQPGSAVWASDEQYEAVGRRVSTALRAGEAVEFEDESMRRDGSSFTARFKAKAIDPLQPGLAGTIWICEDVTAARQAERDLARARDEAEAANRAKSAFLANTSHEIRTPLNGLVGLARLARRPDVQAERRAQYLEQIGDSAETLSMLISDILDLSKIEAGKLEVESAPFDLQELLQALRQAYGALADDHGLGFALELDARLPPLVRGDALRVRQILVNYLQNALKFTARGELRLVARCIDDERVRFEVHDTGTGIDDANQARLFKPFTQADESITRRFGGTGLGLSICTELATLMGGSVGVTSTAGVGSCFHVELPLPAVRADDPVSGHHLHDDALLRDAQVLLVEDNAVNMMIAVALLEQWGVRVVQAHDGRQALAQLARADERGDPIDLVLMDVQMPGISGYEATRQLRQRWSAQALPVIA
ncbi:MAG: PAS domain S-box protein, partial [Burkholderiales bacterium]|nr:PAS domain S-box protein [Burkholderiales bacterium]